MKRPGREVTLVLVDRAGSVLGQLAPFSVATPWWQDLEPVLAAHPEVTILRLLDAIPHPHHVMGGTVRYLAEVDVAPPIVAPAAIDHRDLTDHPLRMPWARPGGPAADLAWAAKHVRVIGRPQQVRSWNLSSIWLLPTDAGDRWLKSVPPFFEHESRLLGLLADEATVPRLIAADGHRMLLEQLPGIDGYDATVEEHRQLIDALVDLQVMCAQRFSDFEGVVPDWRAGPLRAMAAAVIDRQRPHSGALRSLLAGWDDRMAAVAACGLPDTLFHGDAHPGNARIGCDPVWFDWGDGGLGHPLLDLAVLEPSEPELDPVAGELRRHWLARWRAAVPGSDPERAWALLRPIALLRGAVVFQRFLDNIEPSERVYHQHDVAPFLTRAEAALQPS